MPTFSPVILNDGQATPVAHTFNPLTLDNSGSSSVATFVDPSSASVDIGFNEIQLAYKAPSGARVAGATASASRVYKLTASIRMPILESTSAATGTGIPPAPTVAYVLMGKIEFFLPARSTKEQRKDLRVMMANLLTSSSIYGVTDANYIQGYY